MSDEYNAAIHGFHAHVYYDANSVEQARALCEAACARFPIEMGRMHRSPVGPHPDWSCQLAFAPACFGPVIAWLMMHRGDLVVFAHPETGDTVGDHRDRALWMGAVRPLDLSVL